jgi:coniferyl-aldehyde dehydrogenase
LDLADSNEARVAATLLPQLQTMKTAHFAAPQVSVAIRKERLRKLDRLIRDNEAAIKQAISSDFRHRSSHETDLLEIFPALEGLRHAISHVRSWSKPRRASVSVLFQPASAKLYPEPLGVVGIIVPWNYPLLLAVGPMTAAIAAGNRVMVKMSEATPQFSELFAKLVMQQFASDEITVVNGGVMVGQAFSALPFDHLLFTGATAVGGHIMRAASANLTPVTLELGGKSPAIVGSDFSVEVAAARIIWGKCVNAGQTCIAPDYALVPAGKEQAFVDAAKATLAGHYPTLAGNPDYTAIINERHRSRLSSLLIEAQAAGATLIPINPANEDFSASPKLAPTLVLNATLDCNLMREEIFGPILPIVTYRTLDEAVSFINARAKPLALYLFSDDRNMRDKVLMQTSAGGVTLNDTIMHISQDSLPFGGVGASGMGAYHGEWGFNTFSHLKPVFHQSKLNGLKLFKPPYSRLFEKLVKFIKR